PRSRSALSKRSSRSAAATTSGSSSRLAQHYLNVHAFLAAIDSDSNGVTGAVVLHHVGKLLLIRQGLPIDGNDQVASEHDRSVPQVGSFRTAVQAGALCGAPRHDLDH